MAHCAPFLFFVSIRFLLLRLLLTSYAQLLPIVDEGANGTKIYIIHVGRHEHHEHLSDADLKSWHASFLPNSTVDSGAPRLIYSYRHVLSGFAARLTRNELDTVKLKPGFLQAHRDQTYHVGTTYTPKYLGLTRSTGWGSTMMGRGVIIGVLDTGIIPTHASFDDSNMPPLPQDTRWKGDCAFSGIKCNNKIIGAVAFQSGQHPHALDIDDGHGTHVAGIAAGSFVRNADVLGTGGGAASGMAPMAYLAIYKVCYPLFGCNGVDVSAAIDQAIKDGVDVINMSIVGGRTSSLFKDPISKGCMAAIQHGIIPVTVSGNEGAKPDTLSHSAPWLVTVGASSTDRRIESIVTLGNGESFRGESAFQPTLWDPNTSFQLFLPLNGVCEGDALHDLNLRGNIVLCRYNEESQEMSYQANRAGAKGLIVLNGPREGYTTFAEPHLLPVAHVTYPAAAEIECYYLRTGPKATASIRFNGTRADFAPSPAVASFSSRGPSRMNGGLIKPDVVAPGVNILSAWNREIRPKPSPLAPPNFNFQSGTSMAAPHVAGIAALIREKHRDWTPAEVLSAIVTTANDFAKGSPPYNNIFDEHVNETAGIDATGAGQVSPLNALDPGLLFGITLDNYVQYLCGLGYTDAEVTLTVVNITSCAGVQRLSATELNYPSVTVNLTSSAPRQTVVRTARNVGDPSEQYTARVLQPAGVSIDLTFYELNFRRVGQTKSFGMTIETNGAHLGRGSPKVRRGKVVWESSKHKVTLPIAVRFF